MFNNVGSKCKTLAKVVCWLGIVLCVIIGIIMIVASGETHSDQEKTTMLLSGLLYLILGPILSWLGSLSLYAIGETAENSAITANLAIKADMERQNNNEA